MVRNGKDTKVIADGRNAWRKQNAEQREEFVGWMLENGLQEVAGYQVAIVAAKLSTVKVTT